MRSPAGASTSVSAAPGPRSSRDGTAWRSTAQDDRSRVKRDVRPAWAESTLQVAQKLSSVMRWLDQLKKSGLLALHRGGETFADLGGLEALKAFTTKALAGNRRGFLAPVAVRTPEPARPA